MFPFWKKTKGFFVEVNGQTTLIARTSSRKAPMVIEEIKELPVGEDEAVQAAVKELIGKKGGTYMRAACGIYPPHLLLRRFTLDLKRVKEPGYLVEICAQQFHVEIEKCTIAVLNAPDGSDYEPATMTTQKDVVFVGGPDDELVAAQERLLALGVFPDRLELGTFATLGTLASYHLFAQLKAPTLLLEIDADSTQAFIIGAGGLDVARTIPHGLDTMVPVVQKELNLQDEESARKLFLSNTFDFTNIGGLLIRKLLRELQSLIGFYEVQTGQSIGQVLCTHLPPKLGWLANAVAKEVAVEVLKLDLVGWLKSRQVTFASPTVAADLDPRWLGLVSLMVFYDAVADSKK
jgi:hypothetical protein